MFNIGKTPWPLQASFKQGQLVELKCKSLCKLLVVTINHDSLIKHFLKKANYTHEPQTDNIQLYLIMYEVHLRTLVATYANSLPINEITLHCDNGTA